ncbi:MAG TPA: metalloregulator ArsR/SmtB family transcription factor [Longimicrobiales bacterium]|nr:metalloregulator ArsR/SmtB family transcription factor [Longimicrobiales bacterium]
MTGLATVTPGPAAACCAPAGTPALGVDEVEALTSDLDILSHPIRLTLLAVLAASAEPVCVCDLEASVPVKQPTVSHHLKLLRAAGLVESEKRGLWAYYHVRQAELDRLRRRIAAGLGRISGGGDE